MTLSDEQLIEELRNRSRRYARIADMFEEAINDATKTQQKLWAARARAKVAKEDVDKMFPATLEELRADLRRSARSLLGVGPEGE
jgi:hypothetical protein